MKAWQGQGASGAVYRAVRGGWRHSEPVALKVALLPWAARFEREAELLSRLSHPSIPRLLDRGVLQPSSGEEYPFFAMEWIEGTPLYAWAEQHAPSGRQQCRVLAQLARALETVVDAEQRPESSTPPVRAWAWKPWLAVATAGACAVLLWHAQSVSTPRASDDQAPDVGTAAVGDTSPAEPQASTPSPTEKKPVAQEPLPEPSPGQARPDKRGQCPGRKQVPINGGCWVQSSMPVEECVENGHVLFKGKCYGPAQAPPKKPLPTSSPPEAR